MWRLRCVNIFLRSRTIRLFLISFALLFFHFLSDFNGICSTFSVLTFHCFLLFKFTCTLLSSVLQGIGSSFSIFFFFKLPSFLCEFKGISCNFSIGLVFHRFNSCSFFQRIGSVFRFFTFNGLFFFQSLILLPNRILRICPFYFKALLFKPPFIISFSKRIHLYALLFCLYSMYAVPSDLFFLNGQAIIIINQIPILISVSQFCTKVVNKRHMNCVYGSSINPRVKSQFVSCISCCPRIVILTTLVKSRIIMHISEDNTRAKSQFQV